MSANRGQAPSRREREQQARQRDRRILIGVGAVLAVAAVVVVTGLYLTEYLPPRAHVLRIEDTDYNAGDIAQRARYELLFSNPEFTTRDAAVPETLRVLEDDAVVQLRAPDEVGEVSDDDVTAWLLEQFGFEGDDDPEAYAEALATILRAIDMSRDDYEEIVAVQVLRERLEDQFREAIEPETEQWRIARIRLADGESASDLRQQVIDGEDFGDLATNNSIEQAEAIAEGELGWVLPDSLSELAMTALVELEPGELSDVVEDTPFFDIYLMQEREESRPLEEPQIEALVAEQLAEWIEEQRPSVSIERDLSDGESDWIEKELFGDS